jgi:hypothetical protein
MTVIFGSGEPDQFFHCPQVDDYYHNSCGNVLTIRVQSPMSLHGSENGFRLDAMSRFHDDHQI